MNKKIKIALLLGLSTVSFQLYAQCNDTGYTASFYDGQDYYSGSSQRKIVVTNKITCFPVLHEPNNINNVGNFCNATKTGNKEFTLDANAGSARAGNNSQCQYVCIDAP